MASFHHLVPSPHAVAYGLASRRRFSARTAGDRLTWAIWLERHVVMQYIGVIVSKFQTTTGVTRVVVEHMTIVGMLHIFNEEQLERLNGEINNGGSH